MEPIVGRPLIEHVVEPLKMLASRIIVVTSPEQLDFPIACDADIFVDIHPGKGPLGGIYTGLMASGSLHNFVVACDMPFLNTHLLNHMAKLSCDFDAVVPRTEVGRLEPLHAIYSKNCLRYIEPQLEHEKLEAYSFLNSVRVRYIERAECQRFDPQLLSFFNINYQSDLDQAILLAAESEYRLKTCPLLASPNRKLTPPSREKAVTNR